MAGSPSVDEVAAIVADPDWLPYSVRDEARTLKLVYLPREKLSDLAFMDRRSAPGRWERVAGDAPQIKLPIAAMADSARTANSGPCHYIFHSAFCGSTLMSRALDIDGVSCVLREPRALHELADMKPGSKWPDDQRLALDVVLDLMQRRRARGEATIIKPANIANPFIDHILRHQPNSRALLMSSSLPEFLLAIARRRRWRFGRGLASFYRNHLEFETEQTRDLLRLTDLQMAAFLWLQHQAQFSRIVREQPAGRVATLTADVFVTKPGEALVAAAALFELPLEKAKASAITAGPIFQSHSKIPGERFDASKQQRNDALVKLAFGPEIEEALEWGKAVAAEALIPLELPAPLIG